jgi:hypothetical protein
MYDSYDDDSYDDNEYDDDEYDDDEYDDEYDDDMKLKLFIIIIIHMMMINIIYI